MNLNSVFEIGENSILLSKKLPSETFSLSMWNAFLKTLSKRKRQLSDEKFAGVPKKRKKTFCSEITSPSNCSSGDVDYGFDELADISLTKKIP